MVSVTKHSHFEILNNMQISLTNITCASCKNWLTKAIFQPKNGIILCESCCSVGYKTDRLRMAVLEDVLRNLLFPCKYENCNSILKSNQVAEHERICIYTSIVCPLSLCKEICADLTKLEDHLKTQHADESTKLFKPVVKLALEEPIINTIRIATLNQHLFLIHIKRSKSTLSINMARIGNVNDTFISNNFTVHCKHDNAQQSFKKCFVNCSDIRLNSNQDFDISIVAVKPLKIEIFLYDFDQVLKLAECPICEYDLGLEVSQCENGHNVCVGCGKKISTCALCRSENLNIVSLRFLFPNALMLCPNFNNGCLAIGKGDDLGTHVRRCRYAAMKCLECDEECMKYNVFLHMIEKHNSIDNFEVMSEPVKVLRNSTYVSFKDRIFKFQLKTRGAGHTKKICFAVQLLYLENIADVHRYRYEVQILDKNWHNVNVLRGDCQPIGDDDSSSWIYYDKCAKSFDVNNGVEIMKYRCIIIEVGDVM